MAVSKEMWEGIQKVRRGNPGIMLDIAHSTDNAVLLIDPKKKKNWVVNRKGKVRRVIPV